MTLSPSLLVPIKDEDLDSIVKQINSSTNSNEEEKIIPLG